MIAENSTICFGDRGEGYRLGGSEKLFASQPQNREYLGRCPLVPAEEETDEGKVPRK